MSRDDAFGSIVWFAVFIPTLTPRSFDMDGVEPQAAISMAAPATRKTLIFDIAILLAQLMPEYTFHSTSRCPTGIGR